MKPSVPDPGVPMVRVHTRPCPPTQAAITPGQLIEDTFGEKSTQNATLTPPLMSGSDDGFSGSSVRDAPASEPLVLDRPLRLHPVPFGSPGRLIEVTPNTALTPVPMPYLVICRVSAGCVVVAMLCAITDPAASLHGHRPPPDPAGMSARTSCCAAVSICVVSRDHASLAVIIT